MHNIKSSSLFSRHSPLVLAGLLSLILITWLLYAPGLTGGWHFDDHASLSGLEEVQDGLSALGYITSGIAGPLKRPIALASFALQADQWPENPQDLLRVNLIIHLINTLLVFLLALQLAALAAPDGENTRKRGYFALFVAAAWALAPFLASASLMAVQRMTTLSATFTFAGLLLFLHGRRLANTMPIRSLILMTTGLVGGTLLGMYTKENGALLPTLALTAELTLLRHSQPITNPVLRRWLGLMLWLPTLAILGYLLLRLGQTGGFARRNFTLGERLLSQCRILWDYISNLLLPRPASVTPYTDDYAPSRGLLQPATTLVSLLGLVALAIGAWLARRRMPVLSFGLAFFFAGHLIESTTIALELYFAHRNYVPAFGLFFALCWPVFFGPRLVSVRKPLIAALSVWLLLSAAVLFAATSLWGQPERATEVWYRHHGKSLRATQALASLYSQHNHPEAADEVLRRGLEQFPGHQMLTIQRITYCPGGPADAMERMDQARTTLAPSRSINLATAIQLHQFALDPRGINCAEMDPGKIVELINTALTEPPRHRSKRTTIYLHYALAQLFQHAGNFEGMREQLKMALALEPDPQTVTLIAYAWVLQDNLEGARGELRDHLENPPPLNVLQQRLWHQTLTEYLQRLEG